MVETVTPTEPETTVRKYISEYLDCTVTIPDSFHEIADKLNLIPMTLAGEGIEPETVVSVLDSQGYMSRLFRNMRRNILIY